MQKELFKMEIMRSICNMPYELNLDTEKGR